MGIGNSFTDVAVKSSSAVSAEVWSRQISISRPSLGEDSLFSLKLDDDADSSNLLIPQVLYMVEIGKLLLGMNMAWPLISLTVESLAMPMQWWG